MLVIGSNTGLELLVEEAVVVICVVRQRRENLRYLSTNHSMAMVVVFGFFLFSFACHH